MNGRGFPVCVGTQIRRTRLIGFVLVGFVAAALSADLVFARYFRVHDDSSPASVAIVATLCVVIPIAVAVVCGTVAVPAVSAAFWPAIARRIDQRLRPLSSSALFAPFDNRPDAEAIPYPSISGSTPQWPSPLRPQYLVREPRQSVCDVPIHRKIATDAMAKWILRSENPGRFWIEYSTPLPEAYVHLQIPPSPSSVRRSWMMGRVVYAAAIIPVIASLAAYLAWNAALRYDHFVTEIRFFHAAGVGNISIANFIAQQWIEEYRWILLWFPLALIAGGVAISLRNTHKYCISRLAASIDPDLTSRILLSRKRVLHYFDEAPKLIPSPPRLLVPSHPATYVVQHWNRRLLTCASCSGRGSFTRSSTRTYTSTIRDPSDPYGVATQMVSTDVTESYQENCKDCGGRGETSVIRSSEEISVLTDLLITLRRDAIRCAKERSEIERGICLRNAAIRWRYESLRRWSCT